jgi:hypothetical protein
VTSGLLWVRSWIIKLYGLVKRRWQNLHTNSHFGRILRRKSDRRSSLSIRITANILADFGLFSFCYLPHETLRISLTLSASSQALNLIPKCVLNGLLTRCSCNPRFFCLFLCMEMLCTDGTQFSRQKNSYSLTLLPQQ